MRSAPRPEREDPAVAVSGDLAIGEVALAEWMLTFFEAGREMAGETEGLSPEAAKRTRVLRLVAAGVFTVEAEAPDVGVVRLSDGVRRLLREGEVPFLEFGYQAAMWTDDPAAVSAWIADKVAGLTPSHSRRNRRQSRDIFGRTR